MRKKEPNGSESTNVRFEGFCIDLLEAIAEDLDFHYELYIVPDKKFGAEDFTTGEWNGLVKELMDKVSSIHLSILKPQEISQYSRERQD